MRGVLVGETKLATPCLCGLLEVVVAGGVIVGRAQGLAVKEEGEEKVEETEVVVIFRVAVWSSPVSPRLRRRGVTYSGEEMPATELSC